MNDDIYLDANASTPVLPAAAAAAQRVMQESYGNPSSTHYTGIQARELMAEARAQARRVLEVGDGQLTFVSGATEAIQTAVLSALCDIRLRRQHGEPVGDLLLYGATEHKAVPESIAHWNQLLGLDLELRAIPVDPLGRHDLSALAAVVQDAALVCTMAANNETGAISDLDGIGLVLDGCQSRPLWLVDGVQALGKLPLDLARRRIDYAAFSGHKLYAPKGTGLLYVRAGAPFTPLMVGGGQESGHRSGTENLAGIAALGAVLQALENGGTFRSDTELRHMRDQLVASLRDAFPGVVFNTPFDHALPTTINFSVEGQASKDLLDVFDAAGIRVSAGSACSAAKALPSHVLAAMGLPAWRTTSAIRMSFGPAADAAWITKACQRVRHCGLAARRGGFQSQPGTRTHLAQVRQVQVQGCNSWLLLDALGAQCVVVDPHPGTVDALLRELEQVPHRLAAVLGTSSTVASSLARQALLDGLANRHGAHVHPTCSQGWPQADTPCVLADGTPARGLAMGMEYLVKVEQGDTTAYLLGTSGPDRMAADAVRLIFLAVSPTADSLAPALTQFDSIANQQAVLCCANDDGAALTCTLESLQRPETRSISSGRTLHARDVGQFLLDHPEARLVDVREPVEQMVGGPARLHGSTAVRAALSQFANHLGPWLAESHAPLIFVCRSGARSERAAAWLTRMGHRNAWHLHGGLALQAVQAE